MGEIDSVRPSSATFGRPGTDSHAIVIGASFAGLLAARVVADHFGRVTVLERDRLPFGPTPRKGVPQARHVHALLVGGYRLLNRLFPGLEEELAAAGAPRLDWTADFPTLLLGGWSPRSPSDLVTYTCSRTLLEHVVRRRLEAYHNLCILDGQEAVELLYDQARGSVTGVRLRSRPDDAANPRELEADLVVDASGRSSRSPQWLEALGYPRPQETAINAFLGYATRWYKRPSHLKVDWKAVVMGAQPPDHTRGGVIYPIEDESWIVTLGGVARDYPPLDEAGFLDFARTLRSPVLYEAIKEAEPLSAISGYQRTDNCLRHYERLPRWPEGFVVVGDAVCAFNPVYGQGMTVAAMGASALDGLLRDCRPDQADGHLTGLSSRFQRRLAAILKTPWLMATGEDLRWSTTEGGRGSIGPATRLLQRYVDQILVVMPHSPSVHRGFTEVVHMVAPPARLFAPTMLVQVAGHTVRWRQLGQSHPPALPPRLA